MEQELELKVEELESALTPESEPVSAEPSPHLVGLYKELEQFSDTESKLKCIIAFMESALSQTGTPHFKSFWDSRTLCLPLFKEHLSPPVRATLWDKYIELSKEARRLKDLLNEQSAFAEEQVEIAIKALEDDLVRLKEQGGHGAVEPLPVICEMLGPKQDDYARLQHELNFLNASASRINALRKELIKTEMRVRKKNKFFQRLSAAGDQVFPRRKELIKQVSDLFTADVDAFIEHNFAPKHTPQEALFVIREDIKSLQSMAKALTLNAQAFGNTRVRLSDSWEKLKNLDKERRQQRSEAKAQFQQNALLIQQRVDQVSQKSEAGELSSTDAQQKLEEIARAMRNTELGRDEIQQLREVLQKARKPILERIDQEARIRHEQEAERARQKQQKIDDLRAAVDALLTDEKSSVDELIAGQEALLDKIHTTHLAKMEKDEIERRLKPLRGIISDKKEQKLMALSSDDKEALQQLYDLLNQRKERRQEIKDQLETLRKASGGSGLDFERAMSYQAQLNEEKEHLEKMNDSIEELEQKIVEIQNS